MNSGIGAMGPYSHANVTIGRAYGLLSQNLQGGSVPGETYMGSQGNFLNYSRTFAENEEASPWEPFHVQHGFKPGDSTREPVPRRLVHDLRRRPARDLGGEVPPLAAGVRSFTGPIVALDPLVARGFVDRGFTDEAAADRLVRGERAPARQRILGQSVDADAASAAGASPASSRTRRC